ncbi:copper amine oxidase N-terminal domain-containing protein [Paenibacillus athensensis]|uniref:Copper amine oxidase n=1 Tax=Paenibacillus athensensis TaxID=1967502 RepID=A0A4Y8PRK3_9BACL|nr:copper amine oxidase N-terminal domain-containing protein [Paenibacillus athensensis]MCD1260480.1 copper amine oxidase N-terminal domain-containing protein [Paenibacillus athensensis]
MKSKLIKWISTAALGSALLAGTLPVTAAGAAGSYAHVLVYAERTTAFIGDRKVEMSLPATLLKGRMYATAEFLGEAFGFPVVWDPATGRVTMQLPGHTLVLDAVGRTIEADGTAVPFDSAAAVVRGQLLVRVTWIADYLGATYAYNDELRKLELVPGKAALGEAHTKPVAKFALSKPVYRIGEPIVYSDLSYDPQGGSITYLSWTGKQEAFFKAGQYPVSLVATNQSGERSAPYTATVTVEDKIYMSEFEYPFYFKPVGETIPTDWSYIWNNFDNIPVLPKTVTQDTSRKLLVSDSPEEFTEQGVLYRDVINGKARLYADHINASGKPMTFAIVAKNNEDQPVKLVTTGKGEVWPSIYALLLGSEASVDFLRSRGTLNETVTVPPHQTIVYRQMPVFYPNQGTNVIYDVETDGELEMSFVAVDKLNAYTLGTLPDLSSPKHVRGTFPLSSVSWDMEANGFTKPVKIVIGDGKTSDPFLPGFDAMRGKETSNFGNWGVDYKLHLNRPRAMTLMLVAKGGYFKGPLRINGAMRVVPQSGLLTAFGGMQILARTNGTEEALDIEFTPPAGSSFPIDLVMYPLSALPE